MTPEQEQLEAQSRAAIKAWCDDPSVLIEYKFKTNDVWSLCKDDIKRFLVDAFDYRIAKPKKFYRVGKNKDGLPFIIYGEGEEYWQSQPNFEEWLDERKYYG